MARVQDRPAAFFVYVARCADGSFYTGIARDVAARIAAHDAGRGARYTRGRGPLIVCAVRRCASKGDALRLEMAVKRLPRDSKARLTDARRFRALARKVLTLVTMKSLPSRGQDVARPPSHRPREGRHDGA